MSSYHFAENDAKAEMQNAIQATTHVMSSMLDGVYALIETHEHELGDLDDARIELVKAFEHLEAVQAILEAGKH
jgi:murein tripeptide amidase MpaA